MAQGDARRMAPIRPRREPEIKVLKNKITTARVDHLLTCGCYLKAGFQYHQVVALVDKQFTINKGHVAFGCMEVMQ